MARPIALWIVQGVRAGISAGLFSAFVLYLVLLVSFGHLFEDTPGYALALLLFLTHSSVLFGCFGVAVGLFWWAVHSAARRPSDIERSASLSVASCFTLAAAFYAAAWVVFDLLPNRDVLTWRALVGIGLGALFLLWVLTRAPLRRAVLAFVPSVEGTIAVLVLAAIGTAVGAVVRPEHLSRLPDHTVTPVSSIVWAREVDLSAAVRSAVGQTETEEAQIELSEVVRAIREQAESETQAQEASAGVESVGVKVEPQDEGVAREPGEPMERGKVAERGEPAEPGEQAGRGELAGPGESPSPGREEPRAEGAGREEGAEEAPKILNILLLTVDTLRADHLGCYGYARNTSPSVDSLAARGALFSKAYAQRPKTSPNFATILTSTYPQRHGVRLTEQALPEAAYTMAEMLRDLGYTTCGVVTNGNLYPAFGFDQGFEDYFFGHSGARSGTEIAINWLSRNTAKPFFLWVHHTDPHAPYKPPAPYDKLFVDNMATGAHKEASANGGRVGASAGNAQAASTVGAPDSYDNRSTDRDGDPGPTDESSKQRPLRIVRTGTLGGVYEHLVVDGPLDLDFYISQYDGEIAYTDRWIGELLSALRTLGLDKNTLVVFTADHGESLGDHNYYFEHGLFAYEASARIPLIFSLPGIVRRGPRDNNVVESVDFLPTILDLLGAAAPTSCQGRSFAGRIAPEIGGAPEPPRTYAYIEAGYGHHDGPGYTFAMTDGRFKLIVRDAAWILRPPHVLGFLYCLNALFEAGADPPELYDIVQDPGERASLLGKRPAEEALFKAELYDFLDTVREAGRLPPDAGQKALDEETIRALRALGYMR